MPKPATEKTASAPSHYWPLFLIPVAILAAFVKPALKAWNCYTNEPEYTNDRTLHLSTTNIKLEEVITPAAREQGLSGRPCIPKDQGMLFIFNKADLYPFWMKDMKFPIDIIWIDAGHKVVYAKSDAQPSSYPQTFVNSEPAQYVLELPAGRIGQLEIKPGSTLKF